MTPAGVRTYRVDAFTVSIEVWGSLTAAMAREVRYHIEAAALVRGPCELHLNLAGARIDSSDGPWRDQLVAASASAMRRGCSLFVCCASEHKRREFADPALRQCGSPHGTPFIAIAEVAAVIGLPARRPCVPER